MTQIIEAVMFNDELELLEARFQEGKDRVDKWVIIESSVSFTGDDKPRHFADTKDRFSEFSDRIELLKVGASSLMKNAEGPWQRESLQRDWLAFFLFYCPDDSLIVLSDGDELTRASKWDEILDATKKGGSVMLHKPSWYYTLTWALPDWGTMTTSYRSKASRVGALRDGGRPVSEWADDLFLPSISDSGWHLSSLGGPARLLRKMRSFSHQEINIPGWATYENCVRLIKEGVDMAPARNAPLTKTSPAGPEWLVTEGVAKYPWLLTGEDPCTQL